jgi:hypothetical protein
MYGQRSHLFGSGILLLAVAMLVLAACGSDSVSGSQAKTSKPTNAEIKSPPSASGFGPQGIIGAAISKVK